MRIYKYTLEENNFISLINYLLSILYNNIYNFSKKFTQNEIIKINFYKINYYFLLFFIDTFHTCSN